MFSQMKRILRILFFAREHHDQNEIHSSSSETPGEEAGSPHYFLGLLPTEDNPTAVVNINANFFIHPPLPEGWPTARTFGSLNHAFLEPHSLKKQSVSKLQAWRSTSSFVAQNLG